MFDIAFTELLIIGVVALIVIGPERLPKVARTVGSWLGKLNRYVAQVKQDIDRDMQLEELRKLQSEMKATAQKYELMAQEAGRQVEEEVGQVDKVMKAMAATDGGLTMQEYEKAKAEQSAASDEKAESGAAAATSDRESPKQADASSGVKTESAGTGPTEFSSSLDDEPIPDQPADKGKDDEPEPLAGAKDARAKTS